MSRKTGKPDIGAWRRLTSGEAASVKVPRSWSVQCNTNGVVNLARSERGKLCVVVMNRRDTEIVSRTLRDYWTRDENKRGRYLSREVLDRIGDVARQAAVGGVSAAVQRELEWVVGVVG